MKLLSSSIFYETKLLSFGCSVMSSYTSHKKPQIVFSTLGYLHLRLFYIIFRFNIVHVDWPDKIKKMTVFIM